MFLKTCTRNRCIVERAIDLHKNHLLRNQTVELMVVYIFILRYSKKVLKNSLSNIFPEISSKETGL